MEILLIISFIIILIMGVIITIMMLSNRSRKEIDIRNAEEIRALSNLINELKVSNEQNEYKFKVMATETLNNNADHLKQFTSDELQKILNPLKMRLEDFNLAMQTSYTDAAASRKSLSDQIQQLTNLNLTIGAEARNLASALKGNNRIQGKWGETVFESLLESAGLVANLNYETQVTQDSGGKTLRSESGQMLRPDFIIHLPQKRDIIVDSKASLSAYLEFCENNDNDLRTQALKKHVTSIKRHIDELAERNYPKTIDTALEQTLMFIPNDGALILAIDFEPQLIDYAIKKKVTLVSPTQMTGILLLISQMWRKENQDRNAFEIAKLGGLLYDSIESFVKELQGIETGLAKATKSYDSAFSKLVTGQRSVLARAERMKNLGAKTTKSIPAEVIMDPQDMSIDSDRNNVNEAI